MRRGKKEPCAFSKWVYQFGNQCWNSRFTFPSRQIQWYSIKSNINAMHFKSGRHTKKWPSVCVCALVCVWETDRESEKESKLHRNKGATLSNATNAKRAATHVHTHAQRNTHTHTEHTLNTLWCEHAQTLQCTHSFIHTQACMLTHTRIIYIHTQMV